MRVTNALSIIASAALAGDALGVIIWTDDFDTGYTGPNFADLEIASDPDGRWDTAGNTGGQFTRWKDENHSVRPDGGDAPGTHWAGAGTTSLDIFSSRPLGASYSSGVLNLSGWVDSRSSDSNSSNMGGLGFSATGTPNEAYPAVWMRYQAIGSDTLNLLVGGTTITSGDADGTAAASGNVWNHVRLELDLDANVARLYKDSDPAGATDTWVQVGTDAATGDLTISHAVVYSSRDSSIDDLVVDYVPEPACLALTAIGGLMLIRRRR